jgi:chemotaxis protein MotB
MDGSGLRPDQVQQVRGFADQDLRTPKSPGDPSNRRISIIVKYDMLPPDPDPPAAKTKPGEKGSNASTAPPADKSKAANKK